MAALNAWGGVAGGMSSERIGGDAGMMPMGGSLYGYGRPTVPGMAGSFGAIPSAVDANAANLAFTRGATASDPTFKAAKNFLNPNDPNAMYDVAMKGAENAVGGGISGSGVAGQYTGRLRQYDIERRAQLGNQLLSGAYGRTPQPVDPYAQSRLQMDANAENNRLISGIQSRYAPSGGFSQGGYGGGGRSAPMMIGGGGGAPAAPSYQPLAPLSGGGMQPGSGQVAYGMFGPAFNAQQQRSQFYPEEYAQGTMGAGTGMAIPQPQPTWNAGGDLSADDWENVYAGTL